MPLVPIEETGIPERSTWVNEEQQRPRIREPAEHATETAAIVA
jgi:hypothetical protein